MDKTWGNKAALQGRITEPQGQQLYTEQRHDEERSGNIPRQLHTPARFVETPLEAAYIRYFQRLTDSSMSMYPPKWYSLSTFREPEHISIDQFLPYISSKVVRYAVILLAIKHIRFILPTHELLKVTDKDNMELKYRGSFYHSARQAIDNEAYVDIVYACYAMCLCAVPDGEFRNHFNGFVSALEMLVTRSVLSSNEIKSFNVMYSNVLGWLPWGQMCAAEYVGRMEEMPDLITRTNDVFQKLAPDYSPDLRCNPIIKSRFCLLRLSFAHDVEKRLAINGTVYSEMKSVSRDVTRELGALRMNLSQSLPYDVILEQLRQLGAPPFNMTPAMSCCSVPVGLVQVLLLYFLFLLWYFISFEEEQLDVDLEFDDKEVALTVCRLFAIRTSRLNRLYGPGDVVLESQTLSLAGLILAGFHHDDGTSLALFR